MPPTPPPNSAPTPPNSEAEHPPTEGDVTSAATQHWPLVLKLGVAIGLAVLWGLLSALPAH